MNDALSRWLEEPAPPRLPDRVLEATFERTRRSRQTSGWRALLERIRILHFAPALGAAVVVVLAAALALNRGNEAGIGALDPDDPRSEFVGAWRTTDDDGSTPTMTVRASGDAAVSIVVHDDFASVCSGVPSTITGTGRLEGASRLVLPSPELTCEDGSEAKALSGPPLREQLRNLTFVHNPVTDTLTDNFEMIWMPVSR